MPVGMRMMDDSWRKSLREVFLEWRRWKRRGRRRSYGSEIGRKIIVRWRFDWKERLGVDFNRTVFLWHNSRVNYVLWRSRKSHREFRWNLFYVLLLIEIVGERTVYLIRLVKRIQRNLMNRRAYSCVLRSNGFPY